MNFISMPKRLLIALLLATVSPVGAENRAMDVDQAKVDKWNLFSKQLVELHEQLVTGVTMNKKSSTGGYTGEYFNRPDFFVEEAYRDVNSNLLVSRIQREKDRPENVHVLEVFVRDNKGRVQRDYLVAYLPWARNAPIQALVNLHSYNGDLHSFRQFDASGDLIFEQCIGKMSGEPVSISLESHEIVPPRTNQADYRACFESLPAQAGKYLNPQ